MGCLKDASKETLTCNYINFVCVTEISSYILKYVAMYSKSNTQTWKFYF